MFLNIEIKARCADPKVIRKYLVDHKAHFSGIDHQVDTYFNVKKGRLKLRQGIIENNLIYYERDDQEGPKASDFSLVKVEDAVGLKDILSRSLGLKTIVEKHREIYYIGNVKFHIDEVPGLGNFVEIEAGNMLAPKTKEELQHQCEFYIDAFGIKKEDLLTGSYSDMARPL